jgi:hypothetical protein
VEGDAWRCVRGRWVRERLRRGPLSVAPGQRLLHSIPTVKTDVTTRRLAVQRSLATGRPSSPIRTAPFAQTTPDRARG